MNSKIRVTVDFGARRFKSLRSHGFVYQTKKVKSGGSRNRYVFPQTHIPSVVIKSFDECTFLAKFNYS